MFLKVYQFICYILLHYHTNNICFELITINQWFCDEKLYDIPPTMFLTPSYFIPNIMCLKDWYYIF